MANTIKIKNSGTSANAPAAASLEYGELALNYADGKLYFKTGTSTVDFLKSNIALGTDTTGNYMSNVSAGTGITVSHTPAEGSTATVSVDATYNRLVPSGSIIAWGGSSASPPSGFLTCDGTAVSRTTYSALYALIGDRYGAGDGSTTFNLPNFSSGLLPFSTTTLNASPGTGTRQTQTVSSANTSSTGHTHTLANTASSGHTHTLNSTSITADTGNQSQDHSHAQVAVNTGNVSADHSHSGNTGTESANHSHSYFKPNSGANANSGNISANHAHGFTTGGISANHFHTTNAANTGGMSVSHSHSMTHTHTAATVATTNADTAHLHTVASTNSDTAHLHTFTGTYVVYIIKT
jgi:microcystin-dependent protein